MSDTVIKKAIIDSYDREVDSYEKELASVSPHEFSVSFERKMKNLLKAPTAKYVRVFRRPMRLALAVTLSIIMVVSGALVAFAISRPEIRTYIKEMIDSIRYRFTQDVAEETKEFEYIKPKAPGAFRITEEEKEANKYMLLYTDDDHRFINYVQYEPNASTIHISDTGAKENIKIKGNEAEMYVEDDTYYLIWNNGNYVFTLYGDCTKEDLIKMAENIG